MVALRDTHLLGRHLIIEQSTAPDAEEAMEKLKSLARHPLEAPATSKRLRDVDKTLAGTD